MPLSKRGKPSLKASVAGIERAQKIFKQRSLTRQGVAETLGIDRSVVGKFLRGHNVWSQKFEEICDFLGLPWREIAEGMDLEPMATLALTPRLQATRDQIRDYIVQRCGTLRIPGMNHARNVEAIYTHIRLLQGEKVHALGENDEQSITKLEHSLTAEEAVSNHSHLHILGLPGAGKTTFLKYLALQCIQGTFKPELVPIFVVLRDIAPQLVQHDLLTCICQVYSNTCGLESSELRQLFEQGSILLLLDGEDEIPVTQSQAIALTNFDLFYKNRVVITCRTAASRHIYENFTQATIQQFTDNQIIEFSSQWFQSEPKQSKLFLSWLNSIQANCRERLDLASTPLLLTLLCIVFESAENKPKKRHQIYEMAFESILGDLNSSHLIPEESVFSHKTYQEKINVVKALAKTAFDYNKKVFPASLTFLSEVGISLEDWGGLSAKKFCCELEATYGIITQDAWNTYRFSHLSFHEYFVALAFMDQIQADQDLAISDLLDDSRLFNPQWYEVFLFIVEMLPHQILQVFLAKFKTRLTAYLEQQNPQALQQVKTGAEVASRIIHLFKTHRDSPEQAKEALRLNSLEPYITVSAFCSDYYYRFDQARRISRFFDVGYDFNHDLVLAHCFKCNLNEQRKQKLKAGESFDFSDALVYIWTQVTLQKKNQQLQAVDHVRALFFDYVIHNPEQFSQDCIRRFKGEEKRIGALTQLSQQKANLEKSALVAEVSSPEREQHPFLGSLKYSFPIIAYEDPDAVMTLAHYYHGCTLLCQCLSSDLPIALKWELLEGLFGTALLSL